MEGVYYLEIQDFDSKGNLKPYVGNGKPVVVMGQGNFCGYCQKAKPAYQQFAKNGNVVVACIEIDGEENEKKAGQLLPKWDPNYRGVPAYFGFNSNGVFSKVHTGGRDVNSLMGFAKSL